MPTVRRYGPYRFFFYSNENSEPAHIHVQSGRGSAKFWLSPVALVRSRNFSAVQLNTLRRLVESERDAFLEAWNEHFNG